MVYLSRGEVVSSKDRTVMFRGKLFTLSQMEWNLWFPATRAFVKNTKSNFGEIDDILQKLLSDGVIVSCPQTNNFPKIKYYALTESILMIKTRDNIVPLLFGDEKRVMDWLKYSGIPLTVEELIFLSENGIEPTENLLGEENKQTLIATIYPDGKIENNILIKKMESAKCRDFVVNVILGMLRKGYIILN